MATEIIDADNKSNTVLREQIAQKVKEIQKHRTEKEICTTCYDIQDASNFYPVVMELPRTLEDLKACGIDHWKLNQHPAVIILVDKINDMIGRHHLPSDKDFDKVQDAFTYCREMKNGKEK